MKQQQFSPSRLVLLSVLAAAMTFLLLQAWVWTAQFPWSSDLSVLSIPAGIVIAGMLAFVALVMIILRRPG